jgi:hypothetical protein
LHIAKNILNVFTRNFSLYDPYHDYHIQRNCINRLGVVKTVYNETS